MSFCENLDCWQRGCSLHAQQRPSRPLKRKSVSDYDSVVLSACSWRRSQSVELKEEVVRKDGSNPECESFLASETWTCVLCRCACNFQSEGFCIDCKNARSPTSATRRLFSYCDSLLCWMACCSLHGEGKNGDDYCENVRCWLSRARPLHEEIKEEEFGMESGWPSNEEGADGDWGSDDEMPCVTVPTFATPAKRKSETQWRCSVCTFSANSSWSLLCEMCSFGGREAKSDDQQKWTCPTCTFAGNSHLRCSACNTIKPGQHEEEDTKSKWRCARCTFAGNSNLQTYCTACDNARIADVDPSFGLWTCDECTFAENVNAELECSVCRYHREWLCVKCGHRTRGPSCSICFSTAKSFVSQESEDYQKETLEAIRIAFETGASSDLKAAEKPLLEKHKFSNVFFEPEVARRLLPFSVFQKRRGVLEYLSHRCSGRPIFVRLIADCFRPLLQNIAPENVTEWASSALFLRDVLAGPTFEVTFQKALLIAFAVKSFTDSPVFWCIRESIFPGDTSDILRQICTKSGEERRNYLRLLELLCCFKMPKPVRLTEVEIVIESGAPRLFEVVFDRFIDVTATTAQWSEIWEALAGSNPQPPTEWKSLWEPKPEPDPLFSHALKRYLSFLRSPQPGELRPFFTSSQWGRVRQIASCWPLLTPLFGANTELVSQQMIQKSLASCNIPAFYEAAVACSVPIDLLYLHVFRERAKYKSFEEMWDLRDRFFQYAGVPKALRLLFFEGPNRYSCGPAERVTDVFKIILGYAYGDQPVDWNVWLPQLKRELEWVMEYASEHPPQTDKDFDRVSRLLRGLARIRLVTHSASSYCEVVGGGCSTTTSLRQVEAYLGKLDRSNDFGRAVHSPLEALVGYADCATVLEKVSGLFTVHVQNEHIYASNLQEFGQTAIFDPKFVDLLRTTGFKKVLLNAMKMYPSNELVQTGSCTLLRFLTHLNTAPEEMRQVLDALSTHATSIEVQKVGCQFVSIALHSYPSLRDSDIAPVLTRAMRSFPCDSELQISALTGLTWLTIQPSMHKELTSVVTTVMRYHPSSEKSISLSCRLLGSIVQTMTTDSSDIPDLVVHAMKELPSSVNVQTFGCYILSSISLSLPRANWDFLASAMKRFPSSSELQAEACELLHVLYGNNSEVPDEAFLLILAALKMHPTVKAVQDAGCRALGRLFGKRDCQEPQEYAYRLVAAAMQTFSSDARVQSVCCYALRSMAQYTHEHSLGSFAATESQLLLAAAVAAFPTDSSVTQWAEEAIKRIQPRATSSMDCV